MSLIDFILNLAGLLLWLNWRAAALPVRGQPGMSLLSTLRPAGPVRPRVYHWAGLPVLLAGRALFYWQAGPPVRWNPHLLLGPITLSFRSDSPGRMALFSLLSFGVALWIVYLWLLALSCVNTRVAESDPTQRLIRAWLGGLERWPAIFKLLLPLALSAVGWWLLSFILVRLDMVPPNAAGPIFEQGAIIGLGGYLTLKFLIVALLLLYVLNSYVYLGEFALWEFITATARRLLRPLQWLPLRMGKVDLVPLIFIALVLVASEFAQRGLSRLYLRFL
jgi:uncharacterized protein YggT (Ycf19 family)